MNKNTIPTFLKWAGGKRRIINELKPLFPTKIERYFEPFLGGGYVFFFIKQRYNPKYSMISDINKDLIDTFKSVRDTPHELIDTLSYFKKNNSEDFFYNVRESFNLYKFKGLKRSAAFIYLNKTCYNGLFRVNSKGGFNVPFGKYDNPEIYNEETILYASQLLRGVLIKQQHYKGVIRFVKKDDFIYLDPCYDPLKRTSFAQYTSKRFCEEDRSELSKFINELKAKGVKLVLSNNDLPEVREIYSGFDIKEILSSRPINSNSSERGKILELAITG